jgi:CDGSH-type Zn-finger protein
MRKRKGFHKPVALKSICRVCPAVSLGMNGSFYSPDPQCWKDITAEDKKSVTNFNHNNLYSKTIDKIMNKNNMCKCGNSKNMPFCDKSHLKTTILYK